MPWKMASLLFECDGVKYEMSTLEGETATEITKDGEVYATVSGLLVSPQANGVFLSLSFKRGSGAGNHRESLHIYRSQ